MSLKDSEFRADRLNVKHLKLNGIDISNFQIETLGEGKYIDSLRGDIQVQITPSMLDASGNYVIQQIPGLGRFARAEVKLETTFNFSESQIYTINGIPNGEYIKEISTTPNLIITYSRTEGDNLDYTAIVYNDNTFLDDRHIVVSYSIESGYDWMIINGVKLTGSGTYSFDTNLKDLTYYFHSDRSVASSYVIDVYGINKFFYSKVNNIKSNTLIIKPSRTDFTTINLDIWLEQ